MSDTTDLAPDFTVPIAASEIRPFTLSTALDGPAVLAFFPGAFTGTCTTEMRTFEERLDEFDALGASVYGVSTDSPFALAEFREQEALSFGLLADTDKELIDAYDVRTDFPDIGYYGLAQRAVVVVNADRELVYRWVADDPGREPNYDEVLAAVEDAAE